MPNDSNSADDAWKKLLTTNRLGKDPVSDEAGVTHFQSERRPAGSDDADRDDFERDYDRIVFSSAFRRLKDKTQVFPLSKNDYTRTRLTHSIEVSCVGRSLGRKVQRNLEQAKKLPANLPDFSTAVSAACLAHDIGNPPFGHSGEAAIQVWAKKNVGTDNSANFVVATPQQARDLHDFEGNAQALRVLSRIQAHRRPGGMQLTLATLGTMMKYPCGSIIDGQSRDTSRVEQKKFGYFEDERELIRPALRTLGLYEYAPSAFRRHPLAFLVEAADDICYAVVDLEDSVDQKLISVDDASSLLLPLAKRIKKRADTHKGYEGRSRLEWLRALTIQALVTECARVFENKIDEILNGTLHTSLIAQSEATNEYNDVKEAVKRTAYCDSRVLEVEAAGFQVISGLLDFFAPALVANKSNRGKREEKLIWLFPEGYLQSPGETRDRISAIEGLTTYQRLLAATDYISGMTDSFAVDLYQKLSGIRLPS